MARRLNQHQLSSPTAHARLRKFRVVIGHDVLNTHASAQSFFGSANNFERTLNLRARWQQRFAILNRPAVILHVRDFQSMRSQPFGESEHFF